MTSTDQLNTGIRLMFMPGARLVNKVVASEPTPASRPGQYENHRQGEQVHEARVAATRTTVLHQREDAGASTEQPQPKTPGRESGKCQGAGTDLEGYDRKGSTDHQGSQH